MRKIGLPDEQEVASDNDLCRFLGSDTDPTVVPLVLAIMDMSAMGRHELAQRFPTEVHAVEVYMASPVPLPSGMFVTAVELLNAGRSFAILDLR